MFTLGCWVVTDTEPYIGSYRLVFNPEHHYLVDDKSLSSHPIKLRLLKVLHWASCKKMLTSIFISHYTVTCSIKTVLWRGPSYNRFYFLVWYMDRNYLLVPITDCLHCSRLKKNRNEIFDKCRQEKCVEFRLKEKIV